MTKMSTEPLWVVYGLRHVDHPYIYRYVGLTTVGASTRFGAHLLAASSGREHKTPKELWMAKHAGKIVCDVIETCAPDRQILVAREQFWIAYYRERYGRYDSGLPFRCLNVTDGGDGTSGWRATEETRKKMSNSGKGRKFSDEHKANLSLALKGKNTWTTGNPHFDGHTEASKKKISDSLSGEGNPMYGKKGELHWGFGKKRSQATIDKCIETRRLNSQNRVTCPHCPKTGVSGGQMTRWHFDNCRFKIPS